MPLDKSLKDVAINFKWSQYVQVKDRVLYLAENYDGRYSIDQDYEYYPESKMWVVKTVLFIYDENDKNHEHPCHYVWIAQEIEWSSFINKTSSLENACTSSLGRAIACLGIGIENSFASMNEIEKAENRLNDWPFKDNIQGKASTASKPSDKGWYEKTLENVKFMQDCLDELDFMKKIKARVTEIGEKMTKEQEENLRTAYKNAVTMKNIDINQILPD